MRAVVTTLLLLGFGFGCTMGPGPNPFHDDAVQAAPVVPVFGKSTRDGVQGLGREVGVCISEGVFATAPHRVIALDDAPLVGGVPSSVIAQGGDSDDWAVLRVPGLGLSPIDVLAPNTELTRGQRFWIIGSRVAPEPSGESAMDRMARTIQSNEKVAITCMVLGTRDSGPFGKIKGEVIVASTLYKGRTKGLSGSPAVLWDGEAERFVAFGLFFATWENAEGRLLFFRRLNFDY